MQKHTSFLLIWRSTNYQSGTSYINNSGVHTQHLFWLSRSALLKREEEEEEGEKKTKKPHTKQLSTIRKLLLRTQRRVKAVCAAGKFGQKFQHDILNEQIKLRCFASFHKHFSANEVE